MNLWSRFRMIKIHVWCHFLCSVDFFYSITNLIGLFISGFNELIALEVVYCFDSYTAIQFLSILNCHSSMMVYHFESTYTTGTSDLCLMYNCWVYVYRPNSVPIFSGSSCFVEGNFLSFTIWWFLMNIDCHLIDTPSSIWIVQSIYTIFSECVQYCYYTIGIMNWPIIKLTYCSERHVMEDHCFVHFPEIFVASFELEQNVSISCVAMYIP